MRIKDDRHTTLDEYSIQELTVGLEVTGRIEPSGVEMIEPYVRVALTPKPKWRARFDSGAYETNKHGAEFVLIDCDELELMVGALKNELVSCYTVLRQNRLSDKLDAFKKANLAAGNPPS